MKGTASRLVVFLEGSQKRFIIPVYQRNYDWKLANCKQLFDDLVNLVKEGKETHFFGSIVSYAASQHEIVLVDGQQRITTISLILIAIINAIRKGALVAEDEHLAEKIEETYIIDKWNKKDRKVRLKPFREDCDAFDSLIYKNDDEFVAGSKVTANYRYFYERILKQEISVDELFYAIQNLVIIDIELEPHHGDDPQLIFESLNSTGLDLTEADKIRNYILMGLQTDLQEKYYDSYWNKIEKLCGEELDSFVRNYLTIVTGVIPNIRNIYASFKEYAKPVKDIEFILRDMLTYAQAYHRLVSFSLGSENMNAIARRLDALDISVVHPFLMAYLVYADENELPESEMLKVLRVIETIIFRRIACDLPANVLNKVFATLHKSIVKIKKDTDDYSSVLIYILENRRTNELFPKDDRFREGFLSKNIYAMRARYKEYIFERLENGNSKEINDVVANMQKNTYSIEHIMPQTLTPAWELALGDDFLAIHEKYLHTIANLTLTGYNSTYSNRPFEEKKTIKNGFADSGLRLNQYIATFDKWTLDEILARQEKLISMSLEIWPYPTTDFKPEIAEDETVFLSEDNDSCTNRNIMYFKFQGQRYDVLSWADMMLDMANILFAIDSSILYQEASNPKNVWFSPVEESKQFKKLADHLYFCNTASSTWNKMAVLKNLFKLYHLDEDDLLFALRPVADDNEEQDEKDPERYVLRKEFWTEFVAYEKLHEGWFRNSWPSTENWLARQKDGANCNIVANFDFARVEIYINMGNGPEYNKKVFDYLYGYKDEIEAALGEPLNWERLDKKVTSRISVSRNLSFRVADQRPEVIKFLSEYADKFLTIFVPYFQKMKI